jgi:hypothetical protein
MYGLVVTLSAYQWMRNLGELSFINPPYLSFLDRKSYIFINFFIVKLASVNFKVNE